MKKMKLALDVGNTCIKIGCFVDQQLLCNAVYPTQDFNRERLRQWLNSIVGEQAVAEVGLSCVVPRIHDELLAELQKAYVVFDIKPHSMPELIIHADDRNELGADFICAYYGALTKYETPVVVFDLGSATKTLFIDENQEIRGVTIKPGLQQSLTAMVANIPHLPAIDLSEPQEIIGHNTEQAIKAGVFYGELAHLKYFSELLDEHYGMQATKIITGGYSSYFVSHLADFQYEPDLLLFGINKIIEMKA